MKTKKLPGRMVLPLIITLFFVLSLVSVQGVTLSDEFASNHIDISFVSQSPDPARPGSFVDLRFKIENKGTNPTGYLELKIVESYPFTIDSQNNLAEDIGTMQARQNGDDSYIVRYRMKVDEKAVQGLHEVDVHLYSNGKLIQKFEDTAILVEELDKMLEVSSVRTEPERPQPGEPLDVHVTVQNLGQEELRGINLILDLDDTSFSPLTSSNRKILSRLPAGKEGKVTYSLIADPAATSSVHNVDLDMEFSDLNQTSYTTNTTIGILVDAPPEYIVNVDSNEVVCCDRPGSVNIKLSNIGPSEIQYLTFELKESPDYTVTTTNVDYLGNLDSDDFENSEFSILLSDSVSQSEEIMLRLVVSYKDSYNENKRDEIELPLKVLDSQEAQQRGITVPQEGGMSSLLIALAFGVPLFIFWLVMLLDCISRKRKKKSEKIIWLILIVLSTLVGAVLYYFLGRKSDKQ